jgi:hypothetical protein
MIYDSIEWHYNGDYPDDLPPQNGGNHIGIFFSWLVNHRLESSQLAQQFPEQLDAIRTRRQSGREFLARLRDGQLSDGDLGEEGNAFTLFYYDSDNYFKDYAGTLVGALPSLYHVDDSWENYDRMAAVIDSHFAEWHRTVRAKWWRFW